MHPFPHHYSVHTTVRPDGDVPLASEGVRVIESAPPKEFDGPGNQWSPEQLLTAAVTDCFVLSFRAIATASKYAWVSLEATTRGTLDRVDGKMRFTRFDTHAKLHVHAGSRHRTGEEADGKGGGQLPGGEFAERASGISRWR